MTHNHTSIAAEVAAYETPTHGQAAASHHLAHPRRCVGRAPTPPPTRETTQHSRSASSALPPGDGWHSVRPPHRLSVEGPSPGIRVGLHLPPAVPRVRASRRLPAVVGHAADPVQGSPRHPVALAIPGQCDCQGPLGGAQTGPNPTDRGKLGTKRHTLTDQRGVPLAVLVTGANCHDMAAAATLDALVVERPRPTPERPQHLCLDKGYDFPEIETAVRHRCYIPHIRRRGESVPRCRHPARRWVVERTGSWHNRFRKLLTRFEKPVENYLGLVHLACCLIVYRQILLDRLLVVLYATTRGTAFSWYQSPPNPHQDLHVATPGGCTVYLG